LNRTVAVAVCAVVSSGLLSACGQAALRPGHSQENVGAQVTRLGAAHHARCTIYASPNGRRGTSGASSSKPTTLVAAVERTRPGSVVCLERGIYLSATNVTVAESGTPREPITITGYRGTALIQYVGGSNNGGLIQTTFCRPWCASHDLVIENLTLDGANRIAAGVFGREGAHDIKVTDCVISNMGASGVQMNAVDYATVDHNLVYHSGYGQGYSSGIDLWYGGSSPVYGGATAGYNSAPGFHNRITNNVVSGSYDHSVHKTEGHGILIDGGVTTPALLIANNLVYENAGAGISVFDHDSPVWIVNNTGYADGLDPRIGHGYTSEYMAIHSTGVNWVNDLAYGHRSQTLLLHSWTFNNTLSGIRLVHNIAYNGSTLGITPATRADVRQYAEADPLFRNAPAIPQEPRRWGKAPPPWKIGHDFDVAGNSPTIGNGVNPATLAGVPPEFVAALSGWGRR
jgi:hypothetical protein